MEKLPANAKTTRVLVTSVNALLQYYIKRIMWCESKNKCSKRFSNWYTTKIPGFLQSYPCKRQNLHIKHSALVYLWPLAQMLNSPLWGAKEIYAQVSEVLYRLLRNAIRFEHPVFINNYWTLICGYVPVKINAPFTFLSPFWLKQTRRICV